MLLALSPRPNTLRAGVFVCDVFWAGEMKILIAEDDQKTVDILRQGFVENGFSVAVAATGADGLYAATTGDYDVIIMGVMLPQVDGWSILGAVRGAGKQTPILVLSARDAVSDRVKGLELGADDYLVKPYAFSELLARVRSILRRGPGRQKELLRIADLEIDLARQSVMRGDRCIELTAKEFALVSLFAQRSGEILSRTVIAEQVWDMNFDCDTNVVDVAIRRLRGKIDDPFDRKLLHTVRGRGYVLEAR